MCMTKEKGLRALGAVGVVLLLLTALLSWTRPWWLYRVCTAIDVNSGDIARQSYLCGRQISEDIHESAFSREVRRLGIAGPKGRHWRTVTTKTALSSETAHGPYGNLINECNLIMWFLDRFEVPDAERSAVLSETLTVLQAGDMIELSHLESRLGKNLVLLPWETEGHLGTSEDEVAD